VNLTNDHPISFTYDAALAAATASCARPTAPWWARRVRGQTKPKLPLENGQMQCTTCHDPHLRETDANKGAGKFLRLNRLQETQQPTGAQFNETNDIFCLALPRQGRPDLGAVGAREPAGRRRAIHRRRGGAARSSRPTCRSGAPPA
jgi:hypothetical protein